MVGARIAADMARLRFRYNSAMISARFDSNSSSERGRDAAKAFGGVIRGLLLDVGKLSEARQPCRESSAKL